MEGNGPSTSPGDFARNIQVLTVRYAILPWLKERDLREGLWEDVLRHHFKKNGKAMQDTVKTWRDQNPSIRKYEDWLNIDRKGDCPIIDLSKELGKCLKRLK